MKITLDLDSVAEDIYAESALGAVAKPGAAGRPVAVLTGDHRRALMRMAVHAAAYVCSLGGLSHHLQSVTLPAADDATARMSLELNSEGGRVPSEAAVEFHLRSAVSAAALHLVALAGGDRDRADRFESMARHEASMIGELMSAGCPFVLRMHNF